MVAPARRDERSVSQVIGIVLLVGITVVLVGVTAVYMTNLGGEAQEPAPRFFADTEYEDDFDANGQYLNLTHSKGERLNTNQIRFKVRDAEVRRSSGDRAPAEYTGNVFEEQTGDYFESAEEISLNRTSFVDESGNPITGSDHLALGDATVLVVWENKDGTRSEIIYKCQVGVEDCRRDI